MHLIETPGDGTPMRLVLIPGQGGFAALGGDDLDDEIDPIAWIVRHPASTFWW